MLENHPGWTYDELAAQPAHLLSLERTLASARYTERRRTESAR